MAAQAIFSTAYLPPISYMGALLKYNSVWIEGKESWQKQSYRNRCYIDSPNGKLLLNFPIDHSSKELVEKVNLSFKENWMQQHWQAIQTTYSKSPFFDEIAPDLQHIYNSPPSSLLEFNTSLLKVLLDWLDADIEINFTQEWQADYSITDDYREHFHPKREKEYSYPAYHQVFEHKNGFLPNLSVLDLLFNEGRAAYSYLKLL